MEGDCCTVGGKLGRGAAKLAPLAADALYLLQQQFVCMIVRCQHAVEFASILKTRRACTSTEAASA